MKNFILKNGDCLDEFKSISDNSIDMIFADPPFNVGKKYGDKTNIDNRSDYFEWCDRWIEQGFRVLKPTGTFYLMTITRHLGKIYPMMHQRGVFISHINWRNVSAANNKRSYWETFQPILAYGKTNEYKFNTYAQTKPQTKPSWNKERAARAKNQMPDMWDDIPFVYAGSILHKEAIIEDGTRRKIHPAQMPIALGLRPIEFSTDVGDLVLDPFMGIGTVGVACKMSGRRFIGIEKEKMYCDIARKRINNV